MPLNPGDLLNDRYRIDGIIGKGGMGAVYKGFDSALSITVAIKENLNPSPQSVRQFKREAVLLASLRHPNLPRVTDHFLVGDTQYLIMDYIEGDDLKKMLERDGAMSVGKVMDWLGDIVGALQYLHTQNPPIVHRDVKPGNIKIAPDGKPVLVDFGIAKVAEKGGVTTTGARSLTPGFAPPEQYGSSPTDAKSDQYSLAATLYNMLTGQIPSDSIERTLGQAGLTPARELTPSIPGHIDGALSRAMSLNPSDRFESVAKFLEAMEGKLAETETSPALAAFRTPAGPRPEPATRFAATRAAATLLGPDRPGSRPLLLLAGAGGVVLLCAAAIGVAIWLSSYIGGLPGAKVSTPSATATVRIAAASPTDSIAPVQPTRTPEPPTATPTDAIPPTETATNTIEPTLQGAGRLIAFVSNRTANHRYQIFTLEVGTGKVTQITEDSVDKGRLAWSADGVGLYYEARGNAGKWDIFYIDIEKRQPVNLTNDPADDTHPSVNPADGRIAFTSTRNSSVGARMVWLMDSNGANLVNISRLHNSTNMRMPSEWDPAWSPDGRYLFLVLKPTGPVRIYRWGVDSGNTDPRMITMSSGDYTEGEPAVSPDGKRVAYVVHTSSGSVICMASTDPAQRAPCSSPLTGKDFNTSPDWSPDGSWLVYNSRASGNNEVMIMTVTGASQTNVTNDGAEDLYPVWQPRLKGAPSIAPQ